MYYENGVIIKPNVVANGDEATIMYNGLLSNSGADSVYLHVGYGSDWDNAQYQKMERTGEGFETTIPIKSSEQLKLAFKDSAGNWDNNSGRNYAFEVQTRM
ncbi:MAG TPA: carbohydrate-binding protein [Clostridia bacterium]